LSSSLIVFIQSREDCFAILLDPEAVRRKFGKRTYSEDLMKLELSASTVRALACTLLLAPLFAATTASPAGPERWEKDIAAYEEQDRANPPAKGGVVFTGSSIICLWTTMAKDLPDHHVLNRGFGGSQIADATFFANRIIFPYEPKMVVLRAGGNDIHAGKSVEQVFKDYRAFVAKIRTKLPDVPIVFISLSPAPARWEERDANKQLNRLIEAHAKSNPNLRYIETYDMTLNPDGTARTELFVEDRLHFNAEGYKLLTQRVRAALVK
jgi:lysophospholipase L1-like esterase